MGVVRVKGFMIVGSSSSLSSSFSIRFIMCREKALTRKEQSAAAAAASLANGEQDGPMDVRRQPYLRTLRSFASATRHILDSLGRLNGRQRQWLRRAGNVIRP